MKYLKRNSLLLSVPFYIAAVLIFACSKSNPVDSSRNPFWQQTNGPRAGYVMSLVADSDKFIYAGTQNSGVFRTENQGDTWTQTDLTIQLILALAVDSKNNLFAGTAGVVVIDKKNGIKSSDSGIYFSQSGKNWRRIFDADYSTRSITVDSHDHIFAALDGQGIYRSLDGGLSWEESNSGVTDSRVFSLDVSPLNGHLFAGTYHGIVLRSVDEGGSWTQVDSLKPILWDFAFNAQGDIFAATGEGIFRSQDDGDSWSNVNGSLSKIRVFSLLASSNANIFAGTFKNGVFRSTDRGENWTQINAGLKDMTIESLTEDKNGFIYAATDSSGVFRSLQPLK